MVYSSISVAPQRCHVRDKWTNTYFVVYVVCTERTETGPSKWTTSSDLVLYPVLAGKLWWKGGPHRPARRQTGWTETGRWGARNRPLCSMYASCIVHRADDGAAVLRRRRGGGVWKNRKKKRHGGGGFVCGWRKKRTRSFEYLCTWVYCWIDSSSILFLLLLHGFIVCKKRTKMMRILVFSWGL